SPISKAVVNSPNPGIETIFSNASVVLAHLIISLSNKSFSCIDLSNLSHRCLNFSTRAVKKSIVINFFTANLSMFRDSMEAS
ncbi:hypothetical protein, partial [Staphylococcus felis]|uniref:hypothetical protein n=1 Tax=Staphylococcus felis TaxID=46127 RepID=UPI0019D48F31